MRDVFGSFLFVLGAKIMRPDTLRKVLSKVVPSLKADVAGFEPGMEAARNV